MGEFQLIRQFFLPVARQGQSGAVLLGPGDDCAIQRLEPGLDLVFSVDTLVESVHFPVHYDPEKLGWRALAVAASDLAAMGADPVCFTLALVSPHGEHVWFEAFARGLARAAKAFGLALAGGDTTRGPLTLTLQVHGTVPAGQAICRNGAMTGDLVCVSGTLGDAGAALDWLDHPQPAPAARTVLDSYHAPLPRLTLGQALRGHASAAIDVSDGLLADLGHILEASGVGARIDPSSVPVSAALRELKGNEAVALALVAGDDYQLCITIPAGRLAALPESIRQQLTVIGKVTEAPGLVIDGDVPGLQQGVRGYEHFGS